MANNSNEFSTSIQTISKPPIKVNQRMLIIGSVMTLVGILFLFSRISPDGTVTSWLNNLLARWFGIGRYLVPLLIVSIGVYYLLAGMEKQPKLPRQRILGGLLLFIAIESMASIWTVMQSFPDYWAISYAGRGGGYFGSLFGYIVALLIGELGSFITYGLLACVGLFLFFALDLLLLLDKFGELLQLKSKLEPAVLTSPTPSQPSGINIIAPNPDGAKRFQDREFQRPNVGNGKTEEREADTTPAPGRWRLPKVSKMLNSGFYPQLNDEQSQEHKTILEATLASFGSPCKVVEVQHGPMVTQYGVEPEYVYQRNGKRTKVKVSKIAGLADDLALALAAKSVRIQTPVPGKGYIGIEIPSSSRVVVSLRDVMESAGFTRIKSPLRIGLGQDVAGNAISADLATMPHLLIAGATGSGKSVCVNAIIACLLLKNSPDDLRFVMVDPKRVELTGYNGIPHLATPVVVDMDKVLGVLMWALREMDGRYQKFAQVGARNIDIYNKKMEKTGDEKLPNIVIIIDELADLMMTAPEDTERALARLAQMARATGMHMIVATQRPSVNVVTGLIKANFPARIAFTVSSSMDSRVILDHVGAERLLGQGDMLFQKPDAPSPMRMQGCYVSDDELNTLITYWKDARRATLYSAADIEPKPIEIKPADIAALPKAPTDERPLVQKRSVETQTVEREKRKHQPKPEPTLLARSNPDPSDPPVARPNLIPPTKEKIKLSVPLKPFLDVDEEKRLTEQDELWDDALTFVRNTRKASTSMLQRKFRIGYTRAARMVDMMEDEGIIGQPTGTSRARDVLM